MAVKLPGSAHERPAQIQTAILAASSTRAELPNRSTFGNSGKPSNKLQNNPLKNDNTESTHSNGDTALRSAKGRMTSVTNGIAKKFAIRCTGVTAWPK